MLQRLFAIDRSKLRWGLAALLLVAVAVCVALESLVGIASVQSAVAAVVVVVTGGKGGVRSRLTNMTVVTVLGGIFGLLAYFSAENAWLAGLVLAVCAYLTGLAYGISRSAGGAGYLLLGWVLAILIGQSRDEDPTATSIAFLIGGVVAIALVGLVTLATRGRAFDVSEPETGPDADTPAPRHRIGFGDLVHSDLGVWNAVRQCLCSLPWWSATR